MEESQGMDYSSKYHMDFLIFELIKEDLAKLSEYKDMCKYDLWYSRFMSCWNRIRPRLIIYGSVGKNKKEFNDEMKKCDELVKDFVILYRIIYGTNNKLEQAAAADKIKYVVNDLEQSLHYSMLIAKISGRTSISFSSWEDELGSEFS